LDHPYGNYIAKNPKDVISLLGRN